MLNNNCILQNKKNIYWEEWHSFICSQISFLYSLKEDSGFLYLVVHIYCNTLFWLNYMESSPTQICSFKRQECYNRLFTQLHIFSFDTTLKFIKCCSHSFLQICLGTQVELPARALEGWWWVISTMRKADIIHKLLIQALPWKLNQTDIKFDTQVSITLICVSKS